MAAEANVIADRSGQVETDRCVLAGVDMCGMVSGLPGIDEVWQVAYPIDGLEHRISSAVPG